MKINKLTVLVVEDEELIRNEILLTTPWDRFSCEVIGSAENGLEGETLIKSLKPDIVITDIRMPGQDGIEMLRKTSPSAALILTGYSDFDYARQALRLGVNDFIVKPVDDDEFYEALDKISEKLLKEKKKAANNNVFRDFVTPPEGDKQDFYIGKTIQYMNKNYHKDISLRLAAEYSGITESYLSRLFKKKTGYSFLEYLRMLRLKQALVLMQDRSRRINEIARETGFRDMSYFSEIFKKYMGVSPSSYLKGETVGKEKELPLP